MSNGARSQIRLNRLALPPVLAILAVCLSGCATAEKSVAFIEAATGFSALETCSCLYLSNRSRGSCLEDLGPDASKLSIKPDDAAKTVTARVLWSESKAVYQQGYGCRLVR